MLRQWPSRWQPVRLPRRHRSRPPCRRRQARHNCPRPSLHSAGLRGRAQLASRQPRLCKWQLPPLLLLRSPDRMCSSGQLLSRSQPHRPRRARSSGRACSSHSRRWRQVHRNLCLHSSSRAHSSSSSSRVGLPLARQGQVHSLARSLQQRAGVPPWLVRRQPRGGHSSGGSSRRTSRRHQWHTPTPPTKHGCSSRRRGSSSRHSRHSMCKHHRAMARMPSTRLAMAAGTQSSQQRLLATHTSSTLPQGPGCWCRQRNPSRWQRRQRLCTQASGRAHRHTHSRCRPTRSRQLWLRPSARLCCRSRRRLAAAVCCSRLPGQPR